MTGSNQSGEYARIDAINLRIVQTMRMFQISKPGKCWAITVLGTCCVAPGIYADKEGTEVANRMNIHRSCLIGDKLSMDFSS